MSTTTPDPDPLLSATWPGRVAVQISRDTEGLDLHARIWEMSQERGAEVPRIGRFYLAPASWLPDLVEAFLEDSGGGEALIFRRLNGEHLAEVDIQPLTRPSDRCVHGHKYTKANTYIRPDGARRCRTCHSTQAQARDRAKKESRS